MFQVPPPTNPLFFNCSLSAGINASAVTVTQPKKAKTPNPCQKYQGRFVSSRDATTQPDSFGAKPMV